MAGEHYSTICSRSAGTRRLIEFLTEAMTRNAASVILCVLNEEDIEGLLAAGAPAEEYEAEAKVIAEALDELQQHELVADRVIVIVSDVWTRMFGPFDEEQLRGRQPVYRRVAERIICGADIKRTQIICAPPLARRLLPEARATPGCR